MTGSPAGSEGDLARSRLPALPYLAAAMLTFTLALGGAGDDYPLIALTAELLGLLVLWYLAGWRGLTPGVALGWLPGLLVGGAVALPLLQLVPLPPPVWEALPGRELPSRLLALTGQSDGWRPLSLDPAATLGAALELLPALATFFAMLHLDERGRLRLVLLAIGIALVSALLGALQKAGGDASALILFETPHSGNSPGLFVNRNHQASFLLVAMLLSAGAARSFADAAAPGLARAIGAGLVLVFAAGVIATTSRSGFLLLLPALAAALLIIFPARWSWARGGIALLLVTGLAGLASQNEAVQATIERFSEADDERALYWRDTAQAIRLFSPAGSGIGTFPKVYPIVQSVETLSPLYVNNAHNDYLELALDGGAPAVALIGLLLATTILAAFRLWRLGRQGEEVALPAAALAAILVILLHSIFDYPLRMFALSAMFALCWGLVIARTRPA